ncbi:biotin--[acetyl-CoA-carboxylase] ligase [uncultured Helicobacter sp.]|uniref:biotin--[acetyl-CoA-carboxylase] ligase n=1 Tax=uncultured Helicobacter sp. TaxID=175537 RepID=UPI002594C7C0|nr:biotin--[acetyl-CoA-carboxylase] ligase [uncultured Helicobacter sp.]
MNIEWRIEWLDEIDSTQKELERRIKHAHAKSCAQSQPKSQIQPHTKAQFIANPQNLEAQNICLVANKQTNGIGSRHNNWESPEDALMFSFIYGAIPKDIPIQSLAIFFGYILKQTLNALGSKVWLKYPNDLYIENQKIGGIMVSIVKQTIICGIGLNLKDKKFKSLDICIDKKEFLEKYFQDLQNAPNWKQIFRNYKLEFYKNFSFSFHNHHHGSKESEIISLKDAILLDDGSIEVNGRIIYNLRLME